MCVAPIGRPIAPLRREFLLQGAVNAVLGLVAFGVSLATIDHAGRAVLLFGPTVVIFGLGLALRARSLAQAPAAALDASLQQESFGDTIRRTAVASSPVVVVLMVASFVGAGLGALLAGVIVGGGLGDLWGASTVARRGEGKLWRELGAHPFAGPRRPLYRHSQSEAAATDEALMREP